MKSEGDKFATKKIQQYILREQTSLKAFRTFLRVTLEGEQKSLSTIDHFTKDMRQASAKLQSKQLNKRALHFSIHNLEMQQVPNLVDLIQNKLLFWIDELLSRLRSLNEKTRSMESRKSSLVQQQIKKFKNQLTQELTSINQRKESLTKLFCHIMIKNSSHQLQRITDLLRNQFQNQSKEKRNK